MTARTLLFLVFAVLTTDLRAQSTNDVLWSKVREGKTALTNGDYATAHRSYLDAAGIARLTGNSGGRNQALLGLFEVHTSPAYAQRQEMFAESLLQEACAECRSSGDYGWEFQIHSRLNNRRAKDKQDLAAELDALVAWAVQPRSGLWSSLDYLGRVRTLDGSDLVNAYLDARLAQENGKLTSELLTKALSAFEARKLKRGLLHLQLRVLDWTEKSAPQGSPDRSKLASQAMDLATALGDRHALSLACLLLSGFEKDAGKSYALALRAWENCLDRPTEDLRCRCAERLAACAPAKSRALWQAQQQRTLSEFCAYTLGSCERTVTEGRGLPSWTRELLVMARARAAGDPRFVEFMRSSERLLQRNDAVVQPSDEEREWFRGDFERYVEKGNVAAAAVLAEVAGRSEALDAIFKNLRSAKPEEACIAAMETLVSKEHMDVLLSLLSSRNENVATGAAAAILRLVREGLRPDLSRVAADGTIAPAARVYLLGAQASAGDLNAVARLQEIANQQGEGRKSAAALTALSVGASLGYLPMAAELLERQPLEGARDWHGRALARVDDRFTDGMFAALGNQGVQPSRAQWAHRRYRFLDGNRNGMSAVELLYKLPRDKRDLSTFTNEAVKVVDDIEFNSEPEDKALCAWAAHQMEVRRPGVLDNFTRFPDSGSELGGLCGSETNRAEPLFGNPSQSYTLYYEKGRNTASLTECLSLFNGHLEGNTLHLRIAAPTTRSYHVSWQGNWSDADEKGLSDVLDKAYGNAQLLIPGYPPVDLKIDFKGLVSCEQGDVTKIGKLTKKFHPDRWQNKEFDNNLRISGALPKPIGEPGSNPAEFITLDLLATATLQLHVKFYADEVVVLLPIQFLRESLSDKPDLQIERFSMEPQEPAPGEPVLVTVEVRNAGREVTKAGLCHVRFYVKNTQYAEGFRTLAEETFDPVGMQHNAERTFRLQPVFGKEHFLNKYSYTFVPEKGDMELLCMVDSFNMVEESDETNNTSGRVLTLFLDDESASGLAEKELLKLIQEAMPALKQAKTKADLLAACSRIEGILDGSKVMTPEMRAARDLFRQAGNARLAEFWANDALARFEKARSEGSLTPAELRRITRDLAAAQELSLDSGLPFKPEVLDQLRRATLAVAKSSKITIEGAELAALTRGETQEHFPEEAGKLADFAEKLDNLVVLAREAENLRRLREGDPKARPPAVVDAVDAMQSFFGIDKVAGIPGALFGDIQEYNDHNTREVANTMEFIADSINSGNVDQAKMEEHLKAVRDGFSPEKLGEKMLEDGGKAVGKKLPVLGAIMDFFWSSSEDEERGRDR